MLEDAWVVTPDKAPALHRLIDRIADELAGPKPDVVIVNFDWNAGVTHVGLRGRRVLVLGVPLLLALQPRHLLARDVRERELESAPAWRQLSVRTEASLFASHPAPGRRC